MTEYTFGRKVGIVASRAHQVLERAMPIATAPVPPPTSNPFQEAIDGYERMKHEVITLRGELARKDTLLINATREIDALTAKYEHDVAFHREQAEQARYERDSFSRVAVKMATVNNSIGEAASMLVNLALESQRIVKGHASDITPKEPETNIVEGMTANIEDTLRNAGVPHEDRLPPIHY